MDANLGRPSAKIYQFPVRAMRPAGYDNRSAIDAATAFDAPPAPQIIYDGGWYHAEAIAEDRRDHKQ